MISIEKAPRAYSKIDPLQRHEALRAVIANLLDRNRPERALGTAVTRAVEPALKNLNDEDFRQLVYVWGMAPPSIELVDDELMVSVLGCLDTVLHQTENEQGMSRVHQRLNMPSDERQKDITDLVRNRTAELGATRSRDDLNALLAVIVTVTAYAACLIERVPSKLEKVYAKHPWIPKIQLT